MSYLDSAYLDHSSATPLHPAARGVLLAAYDEGWADPSRLHSAGRRARSLLDAAREQVASLLGARPDEVTFAASGTSANHAGLAGALAARHRVGRHFVTSAVEHSSVLAVADRLAAEGGRVTRVGVSRTGVVDVDALCGALAQDTAVVSLQHGNHEVGTLQPVAVVADQCSAAGVPLHVDAAQSVGRVPVDVSVIGASLLTASAHKWGGPPGVGVLVVRKGTRWRSTAPEDSREQGRAPGFVNLPAVVAAAAALDAVCRDRESEASRVSALVEWIRAEVPRLVDDVEVVGEPDLRLPHLVTFSMLYVDGEALVTELDRRGIAVSSGSACASTALQPSHVLAAMGVLTHGNVRVSLGRDTTEADVDALLRELPAVVTSLRRTTEVEGR
ncbi:MAG TPA: cysteine desulfurase family protein [Mycobacteriales bacterium]|nr:cysteine desulfurase family protein [Mycobacteriales bacterium]